jgi:hypothetical protein
MTALAPTSSKYPNQTRLTWIAVGIAIVVLYIRRTWALTHPQLWAEDGSVHLLDNDNFGLRAILMPYRGYLHFLPRVIAWFSSLVADVSLWPFVYNLCAFLITVGLLMRFTSRRLDLPGKPWLVLSFVLAAHTNEVFYNITNLHWITSFFLLQQVLIERPKNDLQLLFDLLIILAVGLTGPFIVVFFPLFVWRWWRDRHLENTAFLLVAGVAAGVQAYFIVTTGPTFDNQALPVNWMNMLTAIGNRLAVWPLFGAYVAEHLPPLALAVIGNTFIVLLIGWSLRPHPQRLLRLQVMVALAAILFACMRRIRPDTGGLGTDIYYGDSYFFISRILIAWLLIWQFEAAERAVRMAARALCVVAVLLQMPRIREPAPTDFKWAENCDAIRRREPANIPILPEGWILQYRPVRRAY